MTSALFLTFYSRTRPQPTCKQAIARLTCLIRYTYQARARQYDSLKLLFDYLIQHRLQKLSQSRVIHQPRWKITNTRVNSTLQRAPQFSIMSTLVLSPRAQHQQPNLNDSIPSPPASSSSSSSSFKLSFTPQSLPPLLSRLPPALLASAESLPIPITPLVPEGKFTYGDTEAIPSSISSIISKTSSASSSSSSSAYSNTSSNVSVGYTESHLPAIDTASLALHYALYNFRVLDSERYATSQYEEAFNWSEIHLPLELAREWQAFIPIQRKEKLWAMK